jgi:GH15 family glucan-1,4-alpha-glucosidase
MHYETAHDIEFIESLYNPFIEKAADFLTEFVEGAYGLPMNSYDLWEEKYGSSTYTASAVYGGLLAAAHFANLLGKEDAMRTYSAVAQRMKSAIMEHLFDPELSMFLKQMYLSDHDEPEYDRTIDVSSFFGPLYFGVIDVNDERVAKAFAVIEERLRVHSQSDGYMRYEGDNYYRLYENSSPNPWVITTLWIAQYHIMAASKPKDLERARELLEWTCTHATKSGVLAEQMHPQTGEHLSTAPLIWSHAEFVITVDDYIKKYNELTKKPQ